MKPEISLQNNSVEQLSVNPKLNVEGSSNLASVEKSVEKTIGSSDKKGEINAIMADVGALQVPAIGSSVIAGSTTIIAGTPLVAEDDDLIEKEWVDRAKKIVAETQNNPYQRGEDVNKLQVDYLKKRFGRELGVAE